MASKEPTISEEPAPGWQRHETEGERPFYKTPIPRTVIRNKVRLNEYLEKEHMHGRMTDLDENNFSFKRRLGLTSRKNSVSELSQEVTASNTSKSSDVCSTPSTTIVQRLTKNSVPVDHKKMLLDSCKMIDDMRLSDAYETPNKFEELKKRLGESKDLIDLLQSLNAMNSVSEALDMMLTDACLSEISRISLISGPLVDFPPSVNENAYTKLIEFAVEQCPVLI